MVIISQGPVPAGASTTTFSARNQRTLHPSLHSRCATPTLNNEPQGEDILLRRAREPRTHAHAAMGILFSQLWRRISGFREVKVRQ